METPSPYTEFGQKGSGKAVPSDAAAIANAINDALASRGVELCELPMTPRRILAALRGAS
jgi:carbon-monoxide dehydrogenase large subunit